MPDPAGSKGLVLDAAIWINLLATEALQTVLDGLAVPCHAPEQVVAEVTRHPVTGVTFPKGGHPLRGMAPQIEVSPLDDSELDLFLDIVGAPAPDGLGDGEAAAIAVAANRGLDVVLDDRKARRIARERFPRTRTCWTVDLLRSQSLLSSVGARQAEAFFEKARRFGRMHVPRS